MRRKNRMLDHSNIWEIPMDFNGASGVLVAKAGPGQYAVYDPNLKTWQEYDQKGWNREFVSLFPLMCPHGKDSAGQPWAGWCIVSELTKRDGREIGGPITKDSLGLALEDHAETLTFKIEGTHHNRLHPRRTSEDNKVEQLKSMLQSSNRRVPALPKGCEMLVETGGLRTVRLA